MPRLKLKWAFGLPGDVQSWAGITLAGGRLFFGSIAGNVYSLDARTGCVHWAFDAGAIVRTAISVGPLGASSGTEGRFGAFFGDARGNAYAVDAATGALVWKVAAETFPSARLTGSPGPARGTAVRAGVVERGRRGVAHRLRVLPVPRQRRGARRRDRPPDLEDPHHSGGAARPCGRTPRACSCGGRRVRRSGRARWWIPVRRALYVTTGNNYSDPTTATSDAFMAMDLETGRILWTHQVTARDAYVSACRLTDKTNCPEANGPDFDFAASPILVTLGNGRRALVAGHKSGNVYAVDPDREGARLWETRVGEGGSMGGVQWGSAADGEHVYVALSDLGRIMLSYTQFTDADRTRGGGMFALRLADGARVWHTPPVPCDTRPRCSPAQSGAVSALPGVAFAGSLDGHLRAYSASTGAVVWDYDTVRTYETVNGVPARGGSLDGPGPVIGGRDGVRELRLHRGRRRSGQRRARLCA